MTDVQTRDDLLAALRDDAARLPEVVAAIGAGDLERGVYENGWSARQLLAHLAAIEWTYPRLIEQARSPIEPPPTSSSSGSGSFNMDAYNHRQVSNRADATIPELLAEFAHNRQATISAIADAEQELLSQPTRSAGGAQGTLLEVLTNVTLAHVRQHLDDLLKGARSVRTDS